MGITPTFGNGFVQNQVAKFQENLDKAVLFMLNYLGESLAKYAKNMHNYKDRTGNLTNSIGYAVVRDRKIVTDYGLNQPGIGGEEAMKVAMKMAADTPSKYSLIIVAGMNYAAYVEARGYNVILPAELKAKKDFPIAMQRLVDKAKRKAENLFGTTL